MAALRTAFEQSSVEKLLSIWLKSSTAKPLVLIDHFAPDVCRTVGRVCNCISAELGPSLRYLRGDILIERLAATHIVGDDRTLVALGLFRDIPAEAHVLHEETLAVLHASPSLFLIDLSAFHIDRFDQEAIARAAEALVQFWKWAEQYPGNRLVLCLPRCLLAERRFRPFLSQNTWCYLASSLYASNHDIKGRRPNLLPAPLRALLTKGSPALTSRLFQFLEGIAQRRKRDGALTEIDLLLDFASDLTAEGFYEAAYRLEVHCRTAAQDREHISMDGDLYFRLCAGI